VKSLPTRKVVATACTVTPSVNESAAVEVVARALAAASASAVVASDMMTLATTLMLAAVMVREIWSTVTLSTAARAALNAPRSKVDGSPDRLKVASMTE